MDPFANVTVKNLGERPFVGRYNNFSFTIPPGESAIIPKEAAIIHFGDGPFFRRDPVTNRSRDFEVARVRGKYGCVDGTEGADTRWDAVKPRVEITELVEGKPVKWITVIDDPEGLTLPLETGGPTAEQRLALMEREMERLRHQVGQESFDPNEILDDTPENAPKRGRPQRAKVMVPSEIEELLAAGED